MDAAEAAGALHDALWLMIELGGPLLLAALAIGLVVSLLQAVTQVNEPTLVFLPKVLVLGGTLVMLGPFMMAQLAGFTHLLMDRMISVGGQ